MTPLETLAGLLTRHGFAEWTRELESLVAREEYRPEGFWEDVASARFWSREGESLARLELPDTADAEAFCAALFALADDLALRGVASEDSEWWRTKLEA